MPAPRPSRPAARASRSSSRGRCPKGPPTATRYGFAVAGERLGASWRGARRLGLAAVRLRGAGRRAARPRPSCSPKRSDGRRLQPTTRSTGSATSGSTRSASSGASPRRAPMVAFAEAVFSDASRYARPDGGDASSPSAPSPTTTSAAYRRRGSVRRAATLIVVGDLAAVDVDGSRSHASSRAGRPTCRDAGRARDVTSAAHRAAGAGRRPAGIGAVDPGLSGTTGRRGTSTTTSR